MRDSNFSANLSGLAVSCKRIMLGAAFTWLIATPAVAAIATDVIRSTDRSTSAANITTPAFSTASANELLLAFVSTDANSAGVNVSSVTGAGLTWQLVRRSNAQLGTAEIWRAYSGSALSNVTVLANLSQSVAASITVVTFTGTDPVTPIGNSAAVSAASGAPSASLTTSRAGSWVFGVGTDWDRPVGRTVGSGQTIVHQFMPTVGDTYWVQMQNAPTPSSGTQVFINDTAPTNDRYNLSIVEVMPALTGGGGTYAASGVITPAASGAGATVTVSQGGTALTSVIADGSGFYSISGLANGAYTLTPSKAGFTFNPASVAVTISGSNVTANFAAAAQTTFTISGTVSPASAGSGATVQLSGAASATTTANASGNFSFTGLANGNYTVTPSKSGFTFNPASLPVTVNNANVSGVAFTAATWSISGTISPNGGGASVSLSGAANATVTANASGAFTFTGLFNGAYTVTPSKAGLAFTPASQSVTVSNGNVAGVAFSTTALPTFGISGTISPVAIGSGTLVTLTGTTGASTTANSSGNYSFAGLPSGSYTVTPSKSGTVFTPASAAVTIASASQANVNFSGAVDAGAVNLPDLSVIVPTGNEIHVDGTGANRVFFYTHDTYNGGSGPLEIQPIYNDASGNYQGYQNVYRFQSPGNWPLVRSTRVAGAFVFHAEHGHFHFPFASFGLYARNADGSVGAAVAISAKVGFCIANSFIYNNSLPNAGYGTWGSCSDPTSLRGLSIGAVDEYDYRDDGQSIPIPNLPDGMYWLRAMADPEGLLEESNETNNETDVEFRLTGNSVTILRTVVPVLPAPPLVSVTSPTGLAPVSGAIQLAASTPSSGVTAVRFLLDGLPFGASVTSPPYALALDTTTLQNGDHWLSAQATTAAGTIGTSAVVVMRVNNSSTSPPTIQITDPDDGAVVSSVTGVGAVAAAQVGIPSVQFYVDGQPIGSPVAAPPFMVQWNTTSVPGGQHILTAKATDQFGLFSYSAPVTVTVDNSSPPQVINIETTVFRDSGDTMQTPAFSTTGPSDLLVAFVAYDGPLGAPQTASVTGAGLTWQLVKRSNAQAGTSEIWSARAASVLTNVTVTSQPTRAGFHGSLTVIAFRNASGPGVAGQTSAATGAPDIYLPGVAAGNWAFAVGNDWDGAIARTPVSGQVLMHQFVDTAVGDTFWVQATAAPSTGTGLVTIHDNAPTTDQWNYAAVEIVATRQ